MAAIVPAGGGPLELAPAGLPADQTPARVYLARLSPGSRRTIAGALTTIVELIDPALTVDTMPWWALRYQHTAAIRAHLAERYAPATANKHIAALRQVLHETWKLGLMSAEDVARAADIDQVRAETLPAGRALTAGELRALFATCAPRQPGDVRDAALMAVLYGCGLRRAEATALNMSSYTAEGGEIRVRRGKGRKDRVVYAAESVAAALAAWLGVRGDSRGALFCPVDKAGRVTVRRMSEQAVYLALNRRAAKAGVAHLSPHDMRRSMVSDLLDAGADLVAVQHLAGHARIETTARYDRRGERAKRTAASMLHVPVPY